jgi:hypothetical protein
MGVNQISRMILEQYHERESRHIENVVDKFIEHGSGYWVERNESQIVASVRACRDYTSRIYDLIIEEANIEMEGE